jgi:hypothetical protein
MIPASIQHGKVDLAEPCQVPWKEMADAGDRNRFCASCKKVVHDITGMSRTQIHDLLASDPGQVCVNFVDIHLPADTTRKFATTPTPAASPMRYIAASAAMWMLLQQGQAAPLYKPRIECIPLLPLPAQDQPSNTLVSGLVVDRNGNPVPAELEIIISCEGMAFIRTVTRGGMFAVDLQGHAAPTDIITVSVVPGPQLSSKVADAPEPAPVSEATGAIFAPNLTISFPDQEHWEPEHWSGGTQEVLVSAAQNMNFLIDYQPGHFYGPIRYGGNPIPDFRSMDWRMLGGDLLYGPCTTTIRVVGPKPPKVQDRSCTDR